MDVKVWLAAFLFSQANRLSLPLFMCLYFCKLFVGQTWYHFFCLSTNGIEAQLLYVSLFSSTEVVSTLIYVSITSTVVAN